MSVLTAQRCALFPLALVAMMVPLGAQAAPDDDNYQGEAADRYAMVRSLEGDVTIQKGDVDETLTRGTPIAEGDLIDSRGRGVLQLADGTRIAFDGATRFQIAALFKDDRGERQVLLRLDYGRVRISLGGEARLRVDTPSGTAAMKDRALVTLEAGRDRTVRVRVASGRVTFSNNRDEVRLAAGERISSYSTEDRLDRVRTFNTLDADPFEAWADGTLRTARGESYQRVPREIRHYAEDLDEQGDWVEVDDAGWCWRPRVSVEWRPYWRGRWGAYAGGLTWVSDEPFGYVTSHFGRWGWTLNLGWYWIPGVYYSPAWVAWNWNPGYCGWAPLNYWNSPCSWGYGPWGGGYCWNVVSVHHFHYGHIDRHIYSDPKVIHTFSGGSGPHRAPWTRSPVVVTPAEMRNPAQLTRAFDAGVRRERTMAYERQAQTATGRGVLRGGPPPTPGAGEHRTPFEDRSRYQVRPDLRRETGHKEAPQPERGPQPRPTAPPREDVRPPAPRERKVEPRPNALPREERQTEPQRDRSRGRGFEVRSEGPREEHRPDPPREVTRERGYGTPPPESRQERRPDPPRERPVEVRPTPPRPDKHEERRSEPPRESRPSSNAGNERPAGKGPERR